MSGKLHKIGLLRREATAFIAVALLAILALGLGISYIDKPGVTTSYAQQGQQFALNSVVAATTGIGLRDQPSPSMGQIVVTMPVNAQAIVVGGPFNGGWYWLEYNGAKAYANGQYLTQVDEHYTPVPLATPSPTSVPVRASDTPILRVTATTPPAPQPTTPSAVPTVSIPTPSQPGKYNGLWLGELTIGGNVRVGPGLDQRVLKSWGAGRRVLLYQAVTDSTGGVWYRVSEPPEPPMYVHSSLIAKVAPVKFEQARYPGRWVNVNITQQVVTAYEGGTPVMVTLASTGIAKYPTELGVWKIYWRLPSQEMKGGSKAAGDYYDLPNVPWVQYFQSSGEALHGTYWHDNFGRPMSHGCVNLSIPIAQWFYGWANIGTIVYVHN